jgi:hypothetical protein
MKPLAHTAIASPSVAGSAPPSSTPSCKRIACTQAKV